MFIISSKLMAHPLFLVELYRLKRYAEASIGLCYNPHMTEDPKEPAPDDFRNGVGLAWEDAKFGAKNKEEWEHWKATGRYRD